MTNKHESCCESTVDKYVFVQLTHVTYLCCCNISSVSYERTVSFMLCSMCRSTVNPCFTIPKKERKKEAKQTLGAVHVEPQAVFINKAQFECLPFALFIISVS